MKEHTAERELIDSAQRPKKGKKLKFWINIFTLIAILVIIYLSRHQFEQVFKNIGQLTLIPLLLVIPLKLLNFFTIAKMYQEYLKVLGEKVKLKPLFLTSLEMNFVNIVFPSGGVSGFSYLALRLRPEGISTAKTTTIQAARFALVFLSFLILILVGMFLLAISGQASNMTILIGSSVTMLTLFGTGIVLFIVSSKKRLAGFTEFLPRGINRVTRLFGRRKPVISIEKVQRVFNELHEDYTFISKDISKLKQTFIWSLLINASELAMIYAVFVAYGEWINPGALILGYAVANFSGLIALFGGAGVYEILMTSVMASAGVPSALALSATLTFRVISFMVFIPVGYYFYQKFLKQRDRIPSRRKKHG